MTDRPCGLADWASTHAKASRLVPYKERQQFSQDAATYLKQHGVKRVLLFYTRLVSEHLFAPLETSNIHPSLLPSFPGMGALAKSLASKDRVIGATLHFVDAGLDTGKIVQQVKTNADGNMKMAMAARISYAQKVWLTLLWYQRNELPDKYTLQPDLAAAFDIFSKSLTLGKSTQFLPLL